MATRSHTTLGDDAGSVDGRSHPLAPEVLRVILTGLALIALLTSALVWSASTGADGAAPAQTDRLPNGLRVELSTAETIIVPISDFSLVASLSGNAPAEGQLSLVVELTDARFSFLETPGWTCTSSGARPRCTLDAVDSALAGPVSLGVRFGDHVEPPTTPQQRRPIAEAWLRHDSGGQTIEIALGRAEPIISHAPDLVISRDPANARITVRNEGAFAAEPVVFATFNQGQAMPRGPEWSCAIGSDGVGACRGTFSSLRPGASFDTSLGTDLGRVQLSVFNGQAQGPDRNPGDNILGVGN